jgi:drug/metabolite transporter (DMT)-like permease
MGKYEWLFYVILAGLAWGTYVPLISYGGDELGGKAPARVLAILCVGAAYFIIGIVFPLIYLFYFTEAKDRPAMNGIGLTFAGLAGVAGAVGAICVVFATSNARAVGVSTLFIAPLIFGLAPVINTLVSIVWHPNTKSGPGNFFLHLPDWKLWIGIVLVGAGAALVLYSKGEAEEELKSSKAPVSSGPSSAPGNSSSPEAGS